MTAVLLAGTCALVYGAADFFGGMATRRSRVMAVVVLSQIAGLAFVALLLPVLPGRASLDALLWGMAAGVAGGLGLILFYRALAGGTMSVVAPTTATMSAALPVVAGLLLGERPDGIALCGVVLALLAVLLVSRDPSAAPGTGGRLLPLLEALIAGAGFGGFFILLKQADAGTGMWPLVGARLASIIIVALLALIARRSLRPTPGSLRVTLVAGVLDMVANVLYLLAAQRGLLVLVAVLVSLYPASTLVLARRVLGERLHAMQVAGVGFALAAVALIAAS